MNTNNSEDKSSLDKKNKETWKRTRRFANKWKKRFVYDETVEMHGFVKSSIVSILNYAKKKDEDNVKKESFEDMCKRLGYDEDFLAKRHDELAIESRGMYALSLVAIFVTTFSISSMNKIVVLSSFVISIMFILSGFVRAFRAWQIKCRDMKNFKEFLNNFENWIV